MRKFALHKVDVLKPEYFLVDLKCPQLCRSIFMKSNVVDTKELNNIQFELEVLLINSIERLNVLTNEPKRKKHISDDFKKFLINSRETDANPLSPNYEELCQVLNTPYPAVYINDKAGDFWSSVHDRDNPLSMNDFMLLSNYMKTRTLFEKYSFNNDMIEKREETIVKSQITPKKELKTLMNNFMEPILGKSKKAKNSVQFGYLTQRLMSSLIEIPSQEDSINMNGIEFEVDLMKTTQMQVNCVERSTFNVLHSLGLVSEQCAKPRSQLSSLVQLVSKQSTRNEIRLRHLVKSSICETVQRKSDNAFIQLNTEIFGHFKNLYIAKKKQLPLNEAEKERFNRLCLLVNKIAGYLDL